MLLTRAYYVYLMERNCFYLIKTGAILTQIESENNSFTLWSATSNYRSINAHQ